MSCFLSRHWMTGAALAGLALGGCGSVTDSTSSASRFFDSLSPYKPEVVQGNFVSGEQVKLLKPGLTRAQVKELLGSPMVTSVFHQNRWDYVFSIKRLGVQTQLRKLTVFFNGDVVDHFEGDTMPTEAEFVNSIDTGQRKGGSVPELNASPEALQAAAAKSAASQAAPAALAPLPANYPTLE